MMQLAEKRPLFIDSFCPIFQLPSHQYYCERFRVAFSKTKYSNFVNLSIAAKIVIKKDVISLMLSYQNFSNFYLNYIVFESSNKKSRRFS